MLLPLVLRARSAFALPLLAAVSQTRWRRSAQEVFKANCYRCHGSDGNIEGG